MTSPPKICLIVEDQPLVAMDTDAILTDCGFVIAGPYAEFRAAMEYLKTGRPDVAIVDLHAQDGSCEPLLELLGKMGVPFVIYSGRNASSAPAFADEIWIGKPCLPEDVIDAVNRAEARSRLTA